MDVFIDHHQTISLRVWQSLQQNGIDHREDRGVGADSERQCEDDYRGESRIFAERADAIPQILPQPLHKTLPASRANDFLRTFEIPPLQAHVPKRFLTAHTSLHLFLGSSLQRAVWSFV